MKIKMKRYPPITQEILRIIGCILAMVAIGLTVKHAARSFYRLEAARRPQAAKGGGNVHPTGEKACLRRLGPWRVTAYCSCERCCGFWADGITFCGHRIKAGDRFVAASPEIPFYTMLIIPGYNDGKPVPVLDRGPGLKRAADREYNRWFGGIIKDVRLDVYFDTHEEVIEWGVKRLQVWHDWSVDYEQTKN